AGTGPQACDPLHGVEALPVARRVAGLELRTVDARIRPSLVPRGAALLPGEDEHRDARDGLVRPRAPVRQLRLTPALTVRHESPRGRRTGLHRHAGERDETDVSLSHVRKRTVGDR